MSCDEHPLADLRKLTKWHDQQHPELALYRRLLQERDAAIAQRDLLRENLEALRAAQEAQP